MSQSIQRDINARNRPHTHNQIVVPAGTITEVNTNNLGCVGSLFRFFRFGIIRFLLSLVALVALPIGLMMILFGTHLEDTLTSDWVERQATVSLISDAGISYSYRHNNESYTDTVLNPLTLDKHVSATNTGGVVVRFDLCELLTIPAVRSENAELSVWVNPRNPSQSTCVPVTRDAIALYLGLGGMLSFWAGWTLFRALMRGSRNFNREQALIQRV